MSADIIDIRTGKPWSRERVARAERIQTGAHRADCTAPFFDLIFFDEDEDVAMLTPAHAREFNTPQ
jgi:hypothetical protein